MTSVLILGANGQLARNTIVKLALTPGMESRRSLGVSRR
jgi:hypothetical protein